MNFATCYLAAGTRKSESVTYVTFEPAAILESDFSEAGSMPGPANVETAIKKDYHPRC